MRYIQSTPWVRVRATRWVHPIAYASPYPHFTFAGNAVKCASFTAADSPACPDALSQGIDSMMTIRLTRGGAKKRPFYHLVATDSRSPRDGRYLERLGFYNPLAASHEEVLRVNAERVKHWLSKGAQPSERVQFLLKEHKVAV